MIPELELLYYEIESFKYDKNLKNNRSHFELITNVESIVQDSIDDKQMISLHTKVNIDTTEKTENPFDLNFSIRFAFKMQETVSNAAARKYLDENGIRIIYPYLRAFMSLITRNFGIPEINLPIYIFD